MTDLMGFVSATSGYEVTLDSKRRPTLPAALLSQVHIQPGDDLIAVPGGEGTIVLRNREAVLAQARANIQSGFKTAVAPGVVERFKQDRLAEEVNTDARFQSRRTTEGVATAGEAVPGNQSLNERAVERGAALLAELGL
ncbi:MULTISPECIES: AbrB/MazE/SpoVT family DNA-binding domain-containing protein [unclassified Nocardioides]|uniref:AbrB/MazE/SpoVT family DNA-binding domain-containing protein n=1 Tax=unclassified Nocardioides TaxID=2615069 RepID=UPI00361AE730